MARTPFKLRSSGPFKMMGSSPMQQSQKKKDAAKRATYNEAIDSVTGDMTDEQLRDMSVRQHGGSANKWNVSHATLTKQRNSKKNATKVVPIEEEKKVVVPKVLEVNQGKKASPAKGKFIDAIKKGNFRDAGNTLKHEIKGIGSGIKAALKDDYNTTSKARDIEHAYNWTKNRSAEKQRVKDAGLEWKDRKKENN